MDDMNNKQEYPGMDSNHKPEQVPSQFEGQNLDQNQVQNTNQFQEQNTNQSQGQPGGQNVNYNTNAENGNTYWESQNAGQNPPLAPEAPKPDTPAQFYQNYQQQMGGTPYVGPQMTQQIQQPPKKSHKKMVSLFIVLALVLSLAGTAFAFRGKILNALSLATKSPEEYYASVEEKAAKANIDKMMSNMQVYDANEPLAYEMSADLSYDKETIDSLLQSFAGMSMSDMENELGINLDNIGFDMVVALEESNIYESLGLRLNQVDIISAEILIDALQEQLYMRFPELSPAYLSQSLSMPEYGLDNLDMSTYFSLIEKLSSDDTSDFFNRYSKIVIEQLKDVELSKNEELEVDGITQKCNMLTVTIDSETMLDIVSAIVKEAKNDDYIIDMLNDFGVSKDDYDSVIEEAATNIEDAYKEMADDGEIVMNVYVNKDAEIIGRDLDLITDGKSSFTLEYAIVEKSDEEHYELTIGDGSTDDLITVTGTQTKKNGFYDGEASIELNLESVGETSYSLELEYEDVHKEIKNKKAYAYGKYSISSPSLMGAGFSLEYDVKDDVQLANIALTMGSKSIISLDTSTKYLKDFDIPSVSSTDQTYDAMYDSEAYLATMDLDKFIVDLSAKLGFDVQSIINNFIMPQY
ncbi:MAG TPA: DUF6583 family protein [Mobilitalea sp.]|nr:DUF6583 family protein [Mobilitalea sp.]